MYKKISIIFLLTFTIISVHSQQLAIKTNLLYAATTTPNLALEYRLSDKSTANLAYGLNLFDFEGNAKFKHWALQPEYRYWFCETFNGHFVGAHLHGGQFNVSNGDPGFVNPNLLPGRFQSVTDRRRQGYLYGAGLSYGYHWLLSPRWSLEGTVGAGYARIHYEAFDCPTCSPVQGDHVYNYWGVTKLGLSLIYFIK